MERKVTIIQTRVFNPGIYHRDCKQCGKSYYGNKESTHCEPCTKSPEDKEKEYAEFERWWLYHIDGPKLTEDQKHYIISKL